MVFPFVRQSAGVMESMKSQTPSAKLQTNLKFQYPMTKTGLEFGILVIVIWNFYSFFTDKAIEL
jgi:hypothetical protein